ncbi:MAG: hypothetical protein PHS73_02535 [Candidatus Peribacteraceae bacterium]|nr:hypothetical protein [Candidatus Peribacteraceae bacterium]
MAWFAGLLAAALLILAYVFLLHRRRVRLSPALLGGLRREWERAVGQQDPVRMLLEAEKVFEHLLTLWRFQGTFADKLRSAGPRFQNVENLWQAHKLRNRIAHESGFQPSPEECQRAVRAFEEALRIVLH